jgi:hypothetical protein
VKSSTALTSEGQAPEPRPRRGHHRGARFAGAVAGVALVVGTVAVWGSFAGDPDGTTERQAPPNWQRPAVTQQGLARRVGVRIVHVAVTGEGGLLDLRFQVVDPNVAANIHDAANPPAIVDEGTGVVADSLLMGHSHTSPFKQGVTYYLIFEDPGNVIQRGGTVSVLLGDAQVEHVQVQ